MHGGRDTITFALRGRVKNWNEERGMWALSVQALFTGMKGIKGIVKPYKPMGTLIYMMNADQAYNLKLEGFV